MEKGKDAWRSSARLIVSNQDAAIGTFLEQSSGPWKAI